MSLKNIQFLYCKNSYELKSISLSQWWTLSFKGQIVNILGILSQGEKKKNQAIIYVHV